jgi:hypothetical protein
MILFLSSACKEEILEKKMKPKLGRPGTKFAKTN